MDQFCCLHQCFGPALNNNGKLLPNYAAFQKTKAAIFRRRLALLTDSEAHSNFFFNYFLICNVWNTVHRAAFLLFLHKYFVWFCFVVVCIHKCPFFTRSLLEFCVDINKFIWILDITWGPPIQFLIGWKLLIYCLLVVHHASRCHTYFWVCFTTYSILCLVTFCCRFVRFA